MVEFDVVIAVPNINTAPDKPVDNVVGNGHNSQYMCVIWIDLDDQQQQGLVTMQQQGIMYDGMKSFVKLVACRGERVLKEYIGERVDGKFQPFMIH